MTIETKVSVVRMTINLDSDDLAALEYWYISRHTTTDAERANRSKFLRGQEMMETIIKAAKRT